MNRSKTGPAFSSMPTKVPTTMVSTTMLPTTETNLAKSLWPEPMNEQIPDLAEAARDRVVAAAQGIVKVQRRNDGASLASLYDPLAMPADLVKAHDTLDTAVDRAFGASRRIRTNHERQRMLFEHYISLTQ